MMRRLRSHAVLTVALVLPLLLLAGPAVAKERASKNAPHVLRVTLKGQVFEGSPPMQLFGDAGGASLHDLTRTIRAAATNPAVTALVLRLKGAGMGWTQRQTLRRELLAFRKSGKPSYCFLTTAGSGDYILASAASEISIHPTGMIEIPGLSMDMMYMKGLLEKLGIHFQELRMGRYKSAVEPLTRTGPSAPVVEQDPEVIMLNRTLLWSGSKSLTAMLYGDPRLRDNYTHAYDVNQVVSIYERNDFYSGDRDVVPRAAVVSAAQEKGGPRPRQRRAPTRPSPKSGSP